MTAILHDDSCRPCSGQLEADVYHAYLINRRTVLGRWLEADALGSLLRLLVQSVPKSIHHAQNLHLPGSCETHFQRDIALDLQLLRLRGVLGERLGYNDDWSRSRALSLGGMWAARADVYRTGKAGRCNRSMAARSAGSANYAAAESCRGNGAAIFSSRNSIGDA